MSCTPTAPASSPPGSTCSVSTTANTFYGASAFAAGSEAVVQSFRVRVADHTGTIFAQQGIYVP
jgi:hypothetical protein